MALKTRNVESLFEICSTTVANHAAEEYDKMTASNHDKEDSSVVNPFNKLPLVLQERVIGVLRMKGLLNVKHRDLLINTQTRNLDSSSFGAEQNKSRPMVIQLLQLAEVRCPQLTDLVLKMNWWNFSVIDYEQFLPNFKHLQVLDVALNYKTFDDRCLQILGIHCRNLRKLNVDWCNVTDKGIEWLCGSSREMMGKRMQIGLNKLCESLEELEITNTSVTASGAAMALQRFPHLRILAYERMVDAFSHMPLDEDLVGSTHEPPLALTHLDFRNVSLERLHLRLYSPHQTRSLRLAISLCPLLTHLDIYIVVGVTDDDLLGITALEKLSVFKLSNVSKELITFDGSLVPIFKAIGRSLTTLYLEHLPSFICLASVMECCPNLEILTFAHCKYSSARLAGLDQDIKTSKASDDERAKSVFAWKRLRELKIVSSSRSEIMAEVFLLILTSSPALQTLTVSHSSTLTDDVLQRVFQCNSFKNLETLRLVDCPCVTKRGADLFRKEENILAMNIVIEEDYYYRRDEYYEDHYYEEENYESDDDEEERILRIFSLAF